MDYWLRPLQKKKNKKNVAKATSQGLLWHLGAEQLGQSPLPASWEGAKPLNLMSVRRGREAVEACMMLSVRLLNADNMAPMIRTSTLMNIHWAD